MSFSKSLRISILQTVSSKIFTGVSFRKVLGFHYKQKGSYILSNIPEFKNMFIVENKDTSTASVMLFGLIIKFENIFEVCDGV